MRHELYRLDVRLATELLEVSHTTGQLVTAMKQRDRKRPARKRTRP